MPPKARSKSGTRRSPSSSAKAKAKAEPKAKAAAAAAASSSSSSSSAVQKDEKVLKAENLINECLAQPDIALVDGRVLDIAVSEARLLDGVDPAILVRGEARLAEYRAFLEDLQRRTAELEASKAAVLALQSEENEAFANAMEGKKQLKKEVEDFFEAVGDSDLGKVRAFVQQRCNVELADLAFGLPPVPVDVEDHEGNTPFSEAACYGELEILELLLQSGAHPNCRNRAGRTPLWRAAYNGHEDVVRHLLEHGADPSIENHAGEPPGKHGTEGTKAIISQWDRTLTAERQKELTVLQKLENSWPQSLLKACSDGNAVVASELIKSFIAQAGDARQLLTAVLNAEDMVDAMWMACTKGHLELCRLFLDANANPDSSTSTGLTCLMIASRKGNTDVVKELLARGVKTHLRSAQGRIAADYAREYGDGYQVHDIIATHCRKAQDWTTLQEEARQAGGNKACGVEAVERLMDDRRNAAAADAATAALKALQVEEIRSGSERYRQLLEERAIAEVSGLG